MRNLFLLLAFMIVGQIASAQMTGWTWDTYKVKYSAPANFKVLKNSTSDFSAGNSDITLTIYPKEGANISYNNMLNSLTTWADQQSLKYDNGAQYLDDLNGYWGCSIEGIATNGLPTDVLLLVDPKYPEIGLYIWLQYKDGYLDTAVEILRSFTPN